MQHTLLGNRNRSKKFLVTIPRVLLKREDQPKKKYYTYEIHIQPIHEHGVAEEWVILRRYSDFYKLHKKLLKENAIVKTLDFPPKKSFGNMVKNGFNYKKYILLCNKIVHFLFTEH